MAEATTTTTTTTTTTQELTYAEVATHSTKKDLYLVVHDKVYNASSFVDEHPGGEEVLLDVSGQDATESFEDVGHSDEAREILDGMIVGDLKRVAGDPVRKVMATPSSTTTDSGVGATMGVGLYAGILVAGVACYAGYKYLAVSQGTEV